MKASLPHNEFLLDLLSESFVKDFVLKFEVSIKGFTS